MMRNRILELIREKEQLPPFPQVLDKMETLLKDPEVQLIKLARLIETDPVLAGRLMKLANSAYFGGGRQDIKTLQMAIGRLGLNMVHKLVYSLSLRNIKGNPKIINHRAFWRHSLAVAVFTRSLCLFIGAAEDAKDMAYLSGLMHDIGILVFSTLLPLEYGALLEHCNEYEKPIEIQEREKFGIDHAELGAIYMEQWWQIHPLVISTVQYHHFPFEGDELVQHYAQIVNVSNGICNNQGIVNGINCPGDFFKEGAWLELGLSLDDAEEILVQVKKALYESELLLTS